MHQLALNGIGGHTVQEVRDNLSYREFIQWVKYINQFGPLDVGYRNEINLAHVQSVMVAVAGTDSKLTPIDFMIHGVDENNNKNEGGTMTDLEIMNNLLKLGGS